MEWTFDPLEIKNAHLNIARLGAIARLYMRNIYGPSTSPLQGGLPTDRLVVEWWLRSERVRRALGEETSDDGTAGPTTAADEVVERIDVPCIIHDWKRDPQRRTLAESLQTRNRLILESAFARGLAIIGYERCSNGDGFFLLGRVNGL
jgi:predicted GNAT superfamily acetyltransferase